MKDQYKDCETNSVLPLHQIIASNKALQQAIKAKGDREYLDLIKYSPADLDARLGVERIHWKFDGLTEEGRQAQLSPKVRCRESSTAVRALASAFETRKIKKNIEARVSFGIESIGKRPPITVAPSAD